MPLNLADIFKKTEKQEKTKLVGYDFHGTLDSGLIPEENAVLITGAKPEQISEIKSYLLSIEREDMPIHHMSESDGYGQDAIKKWKSEKIKELGVDTYYENEEEIVEYLRKHNPDTDIIDAGEDRETGDKFFIMSSFGELLDVAIHLQEVEGKKVVMHIPNDEYKKIGDGIVEKADNWHEYLGQHWIFVIDGCEHAGLQEWLREKGEWVVGTNEAMSELENDRQKGQDWFKKMEFRQPDSKNFTDFDEAISHVSENKNKRYIMKQNGSAPKNLNHLGKFEKNEDMLYHLEEMKKGWSETEYGPVDFDLMEVVEGVEIAASAFFNGHDWLRNSKGKAVCFLNFEHKKTHDGDLGSTCGEMGTLFFGTDETNPIAKDILFRPEVAAKLKETGYKGVFDINGCLTEKEYVAFEPTSRFGVPATSYEFMEGLKTPTAAFLCAMAKGEDAIVEIVKGWGLCQVIVAPPFPVESDVQENATSIGEKLWILKDGKPSDDFDADQMKHIHLENFYRDDEGNYKVATKNGYMLVVTGTGEDIKEARENLLEYIKENIYLPQMSYRQDLGAKIEESL